MAVSTAANLKGADLLDVGLLTKEQFIALLDLAAELKAAKRNGTEEQQLKQKEIVLIFEKTSTRTRCAFEVAAYDQGAHVTYLGPEGSQIGHKESMKDTARVLGRMYDAIEYRGFAQDLVEILAQECRRPGLQRSDRRVPPDANAGRYPDHARALEQTARADRLRLPGRCPQQHGSLAARDGRDARHGRAHRGPEGGLAG